MAVNKKPSIENYLEESWSNRNDYNIAFMRQMQDEIEMHWKFMAWLKYTHPEALEEYRAVRDVERSANNGV
jgi:hypothetical protein